jgi:hypothetical protein
VIEARESYPVLGEFIGGGDSLLEGKKSIDF